MTNFTNVSARAVLASLHISVWAAQRFNRAVSDEVNEQKGAEEHSSRVNCHLFGTKRAGRKLAPEFFAVLDAADALRDAHERQTLPWGRKNGDRLLPTANYFAWAEAIRAQGTAFLSAVDAFVEAYPRLQREAEPRLGKLYRADDFVSPDAVRRLFSYDKGVWPIPHGQGDFRVDLPADHVAAIEADIKGRMEDATRDAMRDAWERLHEAVARVAKATASSEDGRNGTVRDNLIDHLTDVCDVLSRLNVAENADFDAMRSRVQRELAGIAVEDLRTDKRLRADTEKRANAIVTAMSAFYAPAQKAVA